MEKLISPVRGRDKYIALRTILTLFTAIPAILYITLILMLLEFPEERMDMRKDVCSEDLRSSMMKQKYKLTQDKLIQLSLRCFQRSTFHFLLASLLNFRPLYSIPSLTTYMHSTFMKTSHMHFSLASN